ncbi:MAG: hypothetical protein C0596_01220 [Marinilabiliales bacterium]|nr:MAG: hypothetical protein C0596_01220 [Marinilabiliales bacterium]
MKFSKVLNQPYPQNLNKWKLIVIISVFISLFLWVFKPFGLQSLESENKDLIIIGYGFVTFAVLLIDLILIPFIVKNIFNEDNWKLYKEVLWLIFIVLTIVVGNYLYSVKLNVITWHGLTGFVLFTFFTLAIAIIPIVVIILITWNLHLRRNIDSSEKLNSSIDSSGTTIDNTLIKLNSGKEEFAFQINEILFMESDGNYINVNYCSEGVMKRQLIRNTIKNIE